LANSLDIMVKKIDKYYEKYWVGLKNSTVLEYMFTKNVKETNILMNLNDVYSAIFTRFTLRK